MQQVYLSEVSGSSFSVPMTPMPGDTNLLKVSLSGWGGEPVDMDLEVSYDGGSTWLYGGGCKGAVSHDAGIEFHMSYQLNPTHVRGFFSSQTAVNSTVTFLAGT